MNKPQQQEHPKKVRISTGASHTEAVNKQDLPSPTARQKREIGPVSKFSGYPGSIECKKTVYGMKSKVFSLRDVKPEALEAKRHLVQQRMHSRLGTRKEFSTSTWLPVPQRQLSRSLSAVGDRLFSVTLSNVNCFQFASIKQKNWITISGP